MSFSTARQERTRTRTRGPAALDEAEDAFLRAFTRAALLIPKLLDEDLIGAERLATSEYFVLVHLSEAPDERLRMSELATAAAMSLSGMTRVVQRLEAQELVSRTRSTDDGRGWYAVLMEAGLRRLEQAWPAHLHSTRQRIFAHLEGIDLSDITAALVAMSRAVPAAGAGCTEEEAPGGR